jgi:hypothetical protein
MGDKPAMTEEEKKEREARRREREKRHREAKEKKPNRKLDIIDQLDATSIFGTGRECHHFPLAVCLLLLTHNLSVPSRRPV